MDGSSHHRNNRSKEEQGNWLLVESIVFYTLLPRITYTNYSYSRSGAFNGKGGTSA
jgi:hypothetical protein